MPAMQFIDKAELERLIASEQPFRLVAVLPRAAPPAPRIPGSEDVWTIVEALERLGREETIVLYCTGVPCITSTWAYRLLEEHGYRHLRLYPGGLEEWFSAGPTG